MHTNPGIRYPEIAGAALSAIVGVAARRLSGILDAEEAARPRAGVAR
ncbi:MAG: hypothetical protein JWP76_4065 [Dactylosporangium sp.]|jgi:hypothetical protein|nr:hypothetical protein [Dactylosporangium sp.]